MKNKILLFSATVCFLFACNDQEVSTDVDRTVTSAVDMDTATRMRNADSLNTAFMNHWNNRDSNAVRDLIADDAIMLGDGRTLNGRNEIVDKWMRTNMPASSNLRTQVMKQDAGSDYAFSSGTWTIDVSNAAMAANQQGTQNAQRNNLDTVQQNRQGTTQQNGNYTFVWRRQNNRWQITVLDVSNNNPQNPSGSTNQNRR